MFAEPAACPVDDNIGIAQRFRAKIETEIGNHRPFARIELVMKQNHEVSYDQPMTS